MRGEFVRAWGYMWTEVWARLVTHAGAGNAILCDVYSAIEVLPARLAVNEIRPSAFRIPLDAEADLTVRNDDRAAAAFLERLSGKCFISERHIVLALERVASAIDEAFSASVSCRFRSLVRHFVTRHGLHYRVLAPFSFRPSVDGMLCGLFGQIRDLGDADEHFGQLMTEFEESFDDLRERATEGRIKSCIGKQINLAEAVAGKYVAEKGIRITQNRNGRQVQVEDPALSAMAQAISTWPHAEIRNALRNFYKFTCDYPGIRHRGTPGNVLRPLELRDATSALILTIGFSAYLTDAFDHQRVYGM